MFKFSLQGGAAADELTLIGFFNDFGGCFKVRRRERAFEISRDLIARFKDVEEAFFASEWQIFRSSRRYFCVTVLVRLDLTGHFWHKNLGMIL